jgi:hypothetical protein
LKEVIALQDEQEILHLLELKTQHLQTLAGQLIQLQNHQPRP